MLLLLYIHDWTFQIMPQFLTAFVLVLRWSSAAHSWLDFPKDIWQSINLFLEATSASILYQKQAIWSVTKDHILFVLMTVHHPVLDNLFKVFLRVCKFAALSFGFQSLIFLNSVFLYKLYHQHFFFLVLI